MASATDSRTALKNGTKAKAIISKLGKEIRKLREKYIAFLWQIIKPAGVGTGNCGAPVAVSSTESTDDRVPACAQ
jgi:hypothetical protein